MCDCPLEYMGSQCQKPVEKDMNPCKKIDCRHGGICQVGIYSGTSHVIWKCMLAMDFKCFLSQHKYFISYFKWCYIYYRKNPLFLYLNWWLLFFGNIFTLFLIADTLWRALLCVSRRVEWQQLWNKSCVQRLVLQWWGMQPQPRPLFPANLQVRFGVTVSFSVQCFIGFSSWFVHFFFKPEGFAPILTWFWFFCLLFTVSYLFANVSLYIWNVAQTQITLMICSLILKNYVINQQMPRRIHWTEMWNLGGVPKG